VTTFGGLARLQVPPGNYTLDFFAASAGATPRPAGAPAASAATGELMPGGTYLAIATGLLADGSFQLVAQEEAFDLSQPESALLRVVHASPFAPAVDIGAVTTPGTMAATLVEGLSYPMSSDAPGLAVEPGAYTIGVAAEGSASTLFEFDVTLGAGQRVFAVAAGDPAGAGDTSFRLLAIDTAAARWSAASILPK
jgi:hypothetical protein